MTGILHIVVARKPIEGTIVENCLQWETGALNIDACRVTTTEKLTRVLGKTTESSSGWKSVKRSPIAGKDGGRWPANLILGHATGCVYKGTKKVKAVLGGNSGHVDGKNVYGKYGQTKGNGQTVGYADADGNETVEDWECESDCAVKTMGEQSGVKTSGKSKKVHEEYGDAFKFGGGLSTPENQYGDTGTAARFFFNYTEQESDE
jgi:site-specific DNA-methyltransferase (adenine-specific)